MICRKLKIHVLEHGSSVEPWLLCLRCGMLIRFEELYKLLSNILLFVFHFIPTYTKLQYTNNGKRAKALEKDLKFINGYSTVPCIYRKTNILSLIVNWTITLFSS